MHKKLKITIGITIGIAVMFILSFYTVLSSTMNQNQNEELSPSTTPSPTESPSMTPSPTPTPYSSSPILTLNVDIADQVYTGDVLTLTAKISDDSPNITVILFDTAFKVGTLQIGTSQTDKLGMAVFTLPINGLYDSFGYYDFYAIVENPYNLTSNHVTGQVQSAAFRPTASPQ
jgi:hypothetical protein